MITHPGSRAQEPTPAELIRIAPGAWCVCDPELPEDDARRVIAYLERIDGQIDVLWVRDRRPEARYDTLGEAFEAISTVLRPLGCEAS